MLNRRTFLSRAATTTAALSVPTLLTKRAKAQLNLNTAPFHAAATCHAICAAHMYAGTPLAQDYFNIAAALTTLRVEWLQAGLDHVLYPVYKHMTPYMISPQFMNIPLITGAIRPFNPAVTPAMVTATASSVLGNYADTAATLAWLQNPNVRMSDYIQWDINAANCKGFALSGRPHIWPISPQPMGGIGPTSCEGESMAILFGAVAFGVLTVMTDGLDLLALAAFSAIGTWGGIATVGWGTWHAIRGCPL